MNLNTSLWLRLAILLLLCNSFSLFAQNTSLLHYKNCKFSTQNLGSPQSYAVDTKPFWGYYFYDFGDGHYYLTDKENDRPCHVYKKKPDSKPTLFLTPFKSIDGIKSVVCQSPISTGGGVNCTNKDELLDSEKLVDIVTNGGENLVPGHEIQCVVHYKAPKEIEKETEGYLFVFFNRENNRNNSKELLTDNALEWVGYKDYYGERVVGDISLIRENLSAYARKEISRHISDHQQVEIFKTTIKRGQEKRFFFSVQSDKSLTDFQDESRVITMTTIWIPRDKNVLFDKKNQIAEHCMNLLQVHDPNHISVSPTVAYQAKNCAQELTYKVEFENETKEGIVDVVKVGVALNEKLDSKSIRVIKTNPSCPACPTGQPKQKCYEIEKLKDSINIIFHQIGLTGTKGAGWFNKRAKGSVEFTINTKDIRQSVSKANAAIIFNKNKPIKTNKAKVNWREKNVKLQLAYNLPLDTDFFTFSDSLPDLFSVGLTFQNAPIGRGWSRGVDIQYNPLRMFSDTTYSIESTNTIGTINQTENVKLHLLEASYFVGFQTIKFLGVKAGIGLTTPIMGKAGIRAVYSGTQLDADIISEEEVKFGLVQEREVPTIFENEIETQKMFGYKLSLQAEVIDISQFVVGMRYDRRYFPKLYRGANCLHINSLQAYVRFKLVTRKRKCR